MQRVRLIESPPKRPGGDYFPARSHRFIRSGCSLLDCVLGGGWALGRISNIVGDKSVGKTLLAIEASANFAEQYPKGRVFYREAEAAFDIPYARALGLPIDRVDFGPDGPDSSWDTIEDIAEDLEKAVTWCTRHKQPGLYVIDSLDALSSREETARAFDKGSFNLEKQKLVSKLFRTGPTSARALRHAQLSLMVISQVRERIGFFVGEKHTRAGGKALDFYASVALWLSHLKTVTAQMRGVKRATGVRIKAKAKKNKITTPFRECEFMIRFGYGIDEVEAGVDWLAQVGRLDLLGIKKSGVEEYLAAMERLPIADYMQSRARLNSVVCQAWQSVEDDFQPSRRKYNNGGR